MNLDTYKAMYPDAFVFDYRDKPGCLDTGVLTFTPETAGSWGVPFEGGVALYVLSHVPTWHQEHKWFEWDRVPTLEDSVPEALARVQKWRRTEDRRKAEAAIEAWDKDMIHAVLEGPTREHPYRIWMLGNDDTSYSMWFATEGEARDMLALLEACQPLDFDRDFAKLATWTFTN